MEMAEDSVEKAVRTVDEIFREIEGDPAVRGGLAMLEAWRGVSIRRELERWLRTPSERRDRLIRRIAEIWKG